MRFGEGSQEVRQHEHARDDDDQTPACETVPYAETGAAPILDVTGDVAGDDGREQRRAEDEPVEVANEEVAASGHHDQPDGHHDEECRETHRGPTQDCTPT